jgi:hypothetical protein
VPAGGAATVPRQAAVTIDAQPPRVTIKCFTEEDFSSPLSAARTKIQAIEVGPIHDEGN